MENGALFSDISSLSGCSTVNELEANMSSDIQPLANTFVSPEPICNTYDIQPTYISERFRREILEEFIDIARGNHNSTVSSIVQLIHVKVDMILGIPTTPIQNNSSVSASTEHHAVKKHKISRGKPKIMKK